ncbi:CRISPR-associated endonuclease Cas2 (plasmid) [Haloferax mediterranei ATCC 33500]|uniref:CRISPR-associated endoribonuclease Cas2 n=1 Tax=Haloferax mediterranei (strain ATCC 33500 / DSM 1411 / JCM 8866 / NBRC 14739 / NCIMB 2177 / R-4) TaxID=523841 RepID=I3RB33_HALMT|nr:CRISPR-associated endonuclease Cas2 [Haloferax mediterranei]AFK21443.1 CRISPR-associated Cas2 family protein [Haloferax mediterranei ATCC 33500]AHZ24488.1 CRISPR-associated protein Cas2 [Haloferax mediterranei ATCC 33500]ELZ97240.1 CRISPR-associated Cas2 family protein [Haloferax mediterranei ATCC 33500]QCQ76886.1 CRISPR-associated endonuclease Cas2 [Haloferax mediterranei ATCC 33500]
MVYIIVVYDMRADRTRLMLNFLRKYLTHVQNSVFEGEVTEGDLETIRNHTQTLLNPDESTIIYRIGSEKYVDRTVIGEDPTDESRFL